MHVLQYLKSGQAAPPGGRLKFSKNTEFVQTWTCVDEGCIETVWQNSIRFGIVIEGAINARFINDEY